MIMCSCAALHIYEDNIKERKTTITHTKVEVDITWPHVMKTKSAAQSLSPYVILVV